MASPDTKTRALDLARHYLQTLGFNGFSFQTVADALGIRKASLHYYFASKEDLALALLDGYISEYETWIIKVAELPAPKKLELMFKIFYKMSQDRHQICPAGALCADYSSLSAQAKRKLLDFHNTQRNWLIQTLKEGVKDKTLRADVNPPLVADQFMTCIQGGVQIARMRGESESFKTLTKSLVKDILK